MKPKQPLSSDGFTLLEIIVTIVVSALVAVIIVQIATNNTTRSYRSLSNVNHDLALKEVMEEITADYRRLQDTDPAPLVTLQTRINNHAYWSTKPFGAEVGLTDSYCFDFAAASAATWQETGPPSLNCDGTDNNLKVTLSYGDQSLTAVFAR